jgi:hypothetical protein
MVRKKKSHKIQFPIYNFTHYVINKIRPSGLYVQRNVKISDALYILRTTRYNSPTENLLNQH